MTRKRNTDLEATTNGTAVETAPTPPEATVPPPETKKKPVVSYRAPVDKGTSMEVAVWGNDFVYEGRAIVQYSIQVRRSYKDQNGVWRDGGSHRVHDLPVLLFLLEKAYASCLNMRTEDTVVPF